MSTFLDKEVKAIFDEHLFTQVSNRGNLFEVAYQGYKFSSPEFEFDLYLVKNKVYAKSQTGRRTRNYEFDELKVLLHEARIRQVMES